MKKRINHTNIFFCGDLHIGHKNILLENRPFNDLSNMKSSLISNITQTVSKDALLILVGDVCFVDKKRGIEEFINIIHSINRNIIHVCGNHDDVDLTEQVKASGYKYSFESCEVLNLSIKEYSYRQKMSICHYPLLVWDCKHYGSIHVHAHSHGLLKDSNPDYYKNKVVDCGVMNNNWMPFSYSQIKLDTE